MSASVEIAERIEAERAFAIIRPSGPDEAIEVLRGIVEGGLGVAEISLWRPEAVATLEAAASALGDSLLLGAGTVRGTEAAARAIDAGARFLVSPGLDLEVAAFARERGVLHIPGVFSPTEVEAALGAGVELLKLFPAGRLGPGYVTDLLAPFPDARLVAVGGVGAANAADFLAAGAVAVAVGSSLMPADGEPTRAAVAARAAAVRQALSTTNQETHVD